MALQKTYQILLVEDPGDIRLMVEAFKEAKSPVHISPLMDGELAIQQFRALEQDPTLDLPDLVILDLNLPKVHGFEVLTFIKNSTRLQTVPVIVLSTSVSGTEIKKCYELHANCYVIKPVDFSLFFDVVKHIDDFWLKTVILPS
jgi:two-component system, chemotaxis family, response regulator Rcp1